jgi:NAD-dependent SIR2 family protein deacetylase
VEKLAALLQPDQKLAILAGAGVSLDAPSNLLPGWPFIEETVRRAVPKDVDLKAVLSLVDPPKADTKTFTRPGEFVRFEVLMWELVQSGLDPELHVLDCLGQSDKPNTNHFLLAELIRAGCIVVTTNFDTLIELAYEQSSTSSEPRLNVVCFDEDFPETGPSDGDRPTLWKIHGSLDLSQPGARRSIQATMISMLAPRMTRRKLAFLQGVLEDYDLLTVGYSGVDDLDLNPVIAECPSPRKLIWVVHDSSAKNPVFRDGNSLIKETLVTWPHDTVGWQRMLYTADQGGQEIRNYDNVFELCARTTDVLKYLSQVFRRSTNIQVATDEYRFGRNYPVAVKHFFDNWADSFPPARTARYRFVAQLLQTRGFRETYRACLDFVHERIAALEASSNATPNEKLMRLINRYNSIGDKTSALTHLRDELLALRSSLTSTEELVWLRLYACVAWQMQGDASGMKAFRDAAARAKEQHDLASELATLTTWRAFAGYSQWSDLFPEYVDPAVRAQYGDDEINALRLKARAHTGEKFPDEETRRLLQVADETGRFVQIWQQQDQACRDVLDDHPIVRQIAFHRLKRMQRFAIDMGDVPGEMYTTLAIGRLYLIDENPKDAFLYLSRVLELGRIVQKSEALSEAKTLLRDDLLMLKSDYKDSMRKHIQRSMWGRTVDN